MKLLRLFSSPALAMALLFPVSASADVMCTRDVANARYACPAVFAPTVGDFSQVFNFQQFDPTWGNLVRVEVTLDARITDARADLTNTASMPLDVRRFDMTSVVGLLGPSGTGLIEVIPVYSATVPFTIPAGGTVQIRGPGEPPQPSTAVSDSRTLTGGAMAPYVGSGTVRFDLNASPYDDTWKSQQIVGASATTTGGTAALYYYYAVPEPTTMALIGSSLLALGLVVRRRRHTSV